VTDRDRMFEEEFALVPSRHRGYHSAPNALQESVP
jgi:hypothetical protein